MLKALLMSQKTALTSLPQSKASEKSVIKVSKLVYGRVTRYKTRLKIRQQMVISKMIK